MGVQGQVAEPAGAERVDLKGMTILPGLIDMHVHLTSEPFWGGYGRLQFTDSFWAVVGPRPPTTTCSRASPRSETWARPTTTTSP